MSVQSTENVRRYFELLVLEHNLRAEVIRTQSEEIEHQRIAAALERERLLFDVMTETEVQEVRQLLARFWIGF